MTAKVNKNQWKSWKYDPLPAILKTSEPMVTNFGMGDEVGDPYPCAKFHYDPIRDFCSNATLPHSSSARSRVYKMTWLAFTTLHLMQGGLVTRKLSVRPSVGLSVCPFVCQTRGL